VTSQDGTRIGFLRVGAGPAVIALHGSFQSAASHLGLATALADRFSVYLPDRRGHAMSGPTPANYGMQSEVDDVAALAAETGAANIYGISSSALIALDAARQLPQLRRVAVYEPALLMDRSRYLGWMDRFDHELAHGQVAAALITSMAGLDLAPPLFRLLPRRALTTMTQMAMAREEKKTSTPENTMRALAPTLRNEGLLLDEMAGRLESFAHLAADVLLMEGTRKGPEFIKPALDALEVTLPHCSRVQFDGLDHGGPADVTDTNRRGNPPVVAAALRSFFR
jgi:pimeloyl-ACP methyl ester carboxylesterase